MLYCILLYRIVLYCIVLYYIVYIYQYLPGYLPQSIGVCDWDKRVRLAAIADDRPWHWSGETSEAEHEMGCARASCLQQLLIDYLKQSLMFLKLGSAGATTEHRTVASQSWHGNRRATLGLFAPGWTTGGCWCYLSKAVSNQPVFARKGDAPC